MWLASRDTGTTTGLSRTVHSTEAGDIVTVADAKQWARVEHSEDDVLFGKLIAAVEDLTEQYTGLTLREKTMTIEYAQYGHEVQLPYGPKHVVTAVRRVEQGTATALTTAEYHVAGQEHKTLYIDRHYSSQQLQIDLTAGYGIANVPDAIRVAMLKAILSTYEDRQDVVTGTIATVMPNSSRVLLQQYKRFRF